VRKTKEKLNWRLKSSRNTCYDRAQLHRSDKAGQYISEQFQRLLAELGRSEFPPAGVYSNRRIQVLNANRLEHRPDLRWQAITPNLQRSARQITLGFSSR
jgi:hypothetical protein